MCVATCWSCVYMQSVGIVNDYGWNSIVFEVGRGVRTDVVHVSSSRKSTPCVRHTSKLFHSYNCGYISIITGRETEG